MTADPRMKTIMENTWLLQDRLIFTEMVSATPFQGPCNCSNYCSLMQDPGARFEDLATFISAASFTFPGNLDKVSLGSI